MENEKGFLSDYNAVFSEESGVITNLPQPDFYETGYIGRHKLRKQIVKDLTEGAYPVITIVGEGGLGKTALALVAAWDVISNHNSNYEAVLWATAKRTRLVGFEIETNEEAASDGNEVLQELGAYFGDLNKDNAIDSVIEFLATFNTLLIIDNLETILDDNLRRLASNVPIGSKILFTSRVQLASGDKPVQVGAMRADDARTLFKAFAGVSGINDQAAQNAADIDKILAKLNYSPLFIKWYLQAIKAGSTQSQILSKKDLILEFCMQNVLSDLSEKEKTLLGALLASKAPRSGQKISFISKLSGDDYEDAVSSLMRRNIVSQRVQEGKTFFEINMIAKTYASKMKIISNDQVLAIKKEERVYNSEIAKIENNAQISYSSRDIYIDDQEDWVAYKKLKAANRFISEKDFETARKRIDEAKSLSHSYFEIFRIEAKLHAACSEYIEAISSFDTAVELKPNYGPLRYYYAEYLLESGDLDEALVQADHGLRADAESIHLKLIKTRSLTYLGSLDQAYNLVDELNAEVIDYSLQRILIDRKIDVVLRLMERSFKIDSIDLLNLIPQPRRLLKLQIRRRFAHALLQIGDRRPGDCSVRTWPDPRRRRDRGLVPAFEPRPLAVFSITPCRMSLTPRTTVRGVMPCSCCVRSVWCGGVRSRPWRAAWSR
jgi:LuxR family glucitol operon transcriptional activator